MARLLYTSDAVVGPPRSSIVILSAPPGTYRYQAIADLQSVDGRPVSGGRLTTDQSGSLPDFFGPDGDVATLYALQPDGTTGEIDWDLCWPDPCSPSVDHIVPLAKGGAHEQTNVQWTHLVCNQRKGARLAG